jgi:hypothetical protein
MVGPGIQATGMTDWNGFLRTDAFRDYRKKVIEKVSEEIETILYKTVIGSDGADTLKELKGQMKMVRTVLKIPNDLTTDEQVLAQLDTQLAEDMANLTKYLMRRRVQ